MSLIEFNDFWYMYFSNKAFAYILSNNYEKALEDLNEAKKYTSETTLDHFSKFNYQLCSMLKEKRIQFSKSSLKLPIYVNSDKKLALIETIEKQFPGSACKEIYKFHAIYLIQVQVMFEMARSEKDERRVFADIIKDVIEKTGNHRTPPKDRGDNFEVDDDNNHPSNIKDAANAAKKVRRNRSEIAL